MIEKTIKERLENLAELIPCFVYDRVSTLEQAETGLSLANQQNQAERYCQDSGLSVIYQFTIAESARKEGRKIFNQMIKLARLFGIRHLIFKNTDRMSRNYNDLVQIIDLVKNHKFTIHFYEDRKKFDAQSSHTEEFVLGINMAMAKYWSDKISYETRSTYLYKAKKGIAPINTPPFGYLYDKKEKRHYVDETNREHVNYIFSTFKNLDISLVELSETLNKKGLKTSRGGKWNSSTMHRMLTSNFYAGQFEYNGQIWQGIHEPYITLEQLQTNREKLSLKYVGSRKRNFDFLYSGVLRHNGYTLSGYQNSGAHNSGSYTYYRSPHSKISFTEPEINSMVNKAVENLAFSSDTFIYIESLFRESINIKSRNNQKDQERASKQIAKLERENDILIDKLCEGFDPISIQRRMTENRSRIEELTKQKMEAKIDREAFAIEVSKTIQDCKKFLNLWKNAADEEKLEALNEMIEVIEIFDSEALIKFKNPYNFILNRKLADAFRVRTFESMGARRDEVRTLIASLSSAWLRRFVA